MVRTTKRRLSSEIGKTIVKRFRTKIEAIVCCNCPRPGLQLKERVKESSMSEHTIMMTANLSSPHLMEEYSKIVQDMD